MRYTATPCVMSMHLHIEISLKLCSDELCSDELCSDELCSDELYSSVASEQPFCNIPALKASCRTPYQLPGGEECYGLATVPMLTGLSQHKPNIVDFTNQDTVAHP